MMNKGKLFLIPNVIAEGTSETVLPPQLRAVLPSVKQFLAEDIRTARRFLSALKIYDSIESLHFEVLDKDTKPESLSSLFKPIFAGEHMGVISESGCPGIADPGAAAVDFAHRHHIQVIPLVGPSSLLMALMSSGLNGQRFSFQGYLPIDAASNNRAIKELEKESLSKNQTQIFIETPYRNDSLLKNLITNLRPTTRLCIAMDITGEDEFILTKPVAEWAKGIPKLGKKPAVFLFLA